MSESRQRYNETFKREAVKYVQEQTKTLEQVAEELNVNPGTLRNWMGKYRQFENEPVNQGESLRQQSQLIEDQKREIADLKEEIEILKKSCTSSGKKRIKIPVHRRSSLRVSIGEEVQSVAGFSERILQMAGIRSFRKREAP